MKYFRSNNEAESFTLKTDGFVQINFNDNKEQMEETQQLKENLDRSSNGFYMFLISLSTKRDDIVNSAPKSTIQNLDE